MVHPCGIAPPATTASHNLPSSTTYLSLDQPLPSKGVQGLLLLNTAATPAFIIPCLHVSSFSSSPPHLQPSRSSNAASSSRTATPSPFPASKCPCSRPSPPTVQLLLFSTVHLLLFSTAICLSFFAAYSALAGSSLLNRDAQSQVHQLARRLSCQRSPTPRFMICLPSVTMILRPSHVT